MIVVGLARVQGRAAGVVILAVIATLVLVLALVPVLALALALQVVDVLHVASTAMESVIMLVTALMVLGVTGATDLVTLPVNVQIIPLRIVLLLLLLLLLLHVHIHVLVLVRLLHQGVHQGAILVLAVILVQGVVHLITLLPQ